jgi:hypothetical protein
MSKMSGDTFTVLELATACTGGNVSAMAKLLNDTGNTAWLNESASEAHQVGGQVVDRDAVITLYAMRSGDRVGRKLAGVLAHEG